VEAVEKDWCVGFGDEEKCGEEVEDCADYEEVE
jgi:hypothetical protein